MMMKSMDINGIIHKHRPRLSDDYLRVGVCRVTLYNRCLASPEENAQQAEETP